MMYPLDTLKTRVQSAAGASVAGIVRSVPSIGLRGLYRCAAVMLYSCKEWLPRRMCFIILRLSRCGSSSLQRSSHCADDAAWWGR